MKKYMKPLMEGQIFVPNEHIGACGDNEYKINCNVPGWGTLYLESNGVEGLQTERQTINGVSVRADTRLDSGQACGTWHYATFDSEEDFADNGYWVTDGKTYDVFVWQQRSSASSSWHGTTGGEADIVNAS